MAAVFQGPQRTPAGLNLEVVRRLITICLATGSPPFFEVCEVCRLARPIRPMYFGRRLPTTGVAVFASSI
jgi:hypothetical protein